MARLALAHAALAVCSLASSGWEELSNPSLYAHLVAEVDDECTWSLQKDVALSLEFEGGRESLVVRPHTPRSSAASFERRTRLCEHSSSVTRMRGRVAPALLTVSGDAWYALSWFPLVANRAAYAHRFALRHFAWFGGLPEELKALGAPCSGSVYGREQTKKGSEVSVHYAKVFSALAVLQRADTSGLLYIDMDAYIDSVAFFAGAPDTYTALSRHFGSSASVVFADGASRSSASVKGTSQLWRVKSDIFFLRNDDFGARFMAFWLSHRCGFKDQYPLWHLILTEAQRAGCLEKPYADEIYQASYSKARDVDLDFANKSRCEADRFAFDAGHPRPIATLRAERIDSHECPKATVDLYFSYKHSGRSTCKCGIAVHLGDNQHYLNLTYTPSDDSPGSPARTFKARTSQYFESFASVADVFRTLALDVKDATARLAPAEFAAGCCAGTAADGAPLCDHWADCSAPQSRY